MLALDSHANSNATSSSIGDEVKERADIILTSKDMDKKLSAEDYSALCTLADARDMITAYLRGSAMWKGRIGWTMKCQAALSQSQWNSEKKVCMETSYQNRPCDTAY